MIMRKNDVYFTLIICFILKLVWLPVQFSDAMVLLVLLSYRPVSQYIKLQEKQKISAENASKFAEVSEEIADVRKTLESIKIQEQMKQQFGIKK
jgi:ABC-type transport system involved in cytochrome bd biosynthesis fused ATPase/permease subunit